MRPQRCFILMLSNELKHLNNLQEIFIYLICALVVVKCISVSEPVLMAAALAKMLLCMNVQIYLRNVKFAYASEWCKFCRFSYV